MKAGDIYKGKNSSRDAEIVTVGNMCVFYRYCDDGNEHCNSISNFNKLFEPAPKRLFAIAIRKGDELVFAHQRFSCENEANEAQKRVMEAPWNHAAKVVDVTDMFQ